MTEREIKKISSFGTIISNNGVDIFHSKSKTFLVCLKDGHLNLVNLFNRECEITLKGDGDPFSAFALRKETLLTSSKNGTLKLWDLEDKRCIKEFSIKLKDITQLCFSSSLTMAAFLTMKNFVHVFSLAKGFITHRFTCDKPLCKVVLEQNHPNHLFCLSTDGSILIFDLKTKAKIELKNHYAAVKNIRFSSDGSLMVSCSQDKVVSLWKLSDMKHLATKKNKAIKTFLAKESVEDIIPIFKGDNLAGFYFGGESGEIKKFDTTHNKVIQKSKKLSSMRIMQILPISSNPHDFAVVTEDFLIAILERLETKRIFMGNMNGTTLISKLKTGVEMAIGDCSPVIKLINLSNYQTRLLIGHKADVTALNCRDQNDYLISGDKNGEIKIWSTESLQCVYAEKTDKKSPIIDVALNAEKERFVSFNESGTLCVSTFCPKSEENRLETNRNPKRVKTEPPRRKFVVANGKGNSMDLSFNCAVVAVTTMNPEIKIFSFPKLKPLGDLKGHRKAVWEARFSPKERVLASCSSDKTVKIWSMSQMSCLKSFDASSAAVHGVAFSPKGETILSFGSDSVMKLWDVSSEKKLLELFSVSQVEQINSAAYCENGNLVTVTNESISQWRQTTAKSELDLKDQSESTERDGITQTPKESKLILTEKIQQNIRDGNFSEAFLLTLRKGSPKQLETLLSLWKMPLENGKESPALNGPVEKEMVRNLIDIAIDWVSVNKTSNMAQCVLKFLLSRISAEDLVGICEREKVETLMAFTAKKWERTRNLLRENAILNVFGETDFGTNKGI